MAGYVMKMSIVVSNNNHRGQKDLSFKVRHKAYARPLASMSALFQKTIFVCVSFLEL